MDEPNEYEVESVTRACVHDKKGKKITWKYYVKWKGYDWNDSTWEPTDSFQGGSEHIIESFWERVDTSGRDISDASAFKKGEEVFISGPPGRQPLKRKTNPAKTHVPRPSKDVSSSNDVTISAPLLTPRKRRRVQPTPDDKWGYSNLRGRVSTEVSRTSGISSRARKRRRASSPGPRKSAPKRQPSAGDSQLDADGETDPDVVEVEDELMQVSAEEEVTAARLPVTASRIQNGSREIAFDDLEHFYSGNPIDIEQNADEQVTLQKPAGTLQPQSPSPQTPPLSTSPLPEDASESRAAASQVVDSYDPLFDSPSAIQRDAGLPHHRARAAKPLVKLMDTTTTTLEGTSKQTRITAKARLMSFHATDMPSASGSTDAKRGRKPGPGRSSSGLITRNRSSLLTVTKGALKSVKGKFTAPTEQDQPDEIEEVPVTRGTNKGDNLVNSWSDEDVIVADPVCQTTSKIQPDRPPSGDELLKLAGLETGSEQQLPDYEEDSSAQPQEVVETRKPDAVSAPSGEEPPNQSPAKITEEPKASDHAAETLPSPSVSGVGQRTSTPVCDNPSDPSGITPVDEAVKKNIELAKEQLFPSPQTSFDSFSTTQSSFRSTIFGPLYQGSAANCVPVTTNESLTTFKVILGDGVEVPLVLKDSTQMKARINDILIGNSSGSKVALFYSAEDALAMVSTFKSDGTARVVLDPVAEAMQQERFSALLQRFESCHTLIAPVGKEVCVLYSSENVGVAEKLGTPDHLRGLSSTLLISHASIENQLAYVGAIMKATAL